MIDYALYGDTDSVYLLIDGFCKEHLGEDFWNSKTDREKIDIINKISDYIVNYVNKRTYEEIQKGTYGSTVTDFKIRFEKEKIAKSGLFVAKKKYCVRPLWIEGEYTDKISITGLEVVRGDSSEAIRYRLKDVMYMILKNEPSEDIRNRIDQYKMELRKVSPEEIAANIGVNNIKKWTSSESRPKKGTPWHVKGAINYKNLLKSLNLTSKYEDISEGLKAKVVYVKNNKWGYETVTFYKWPKEFDEFIQIDMPTMINKFFIKKIEMLLEPANRIDILVDKDDTIDIFFGGK